jgi:hypothetical protein
MRQLLDEAAVHLESGRLTKGAQYLDRSAVVHSNQIGELSIFFNPLALKNLTDHSASFPERLKHLWIVPYCGSPAVVATVGATSSATMELSMDTIVSERADTCAGHVGQLNDEIESALRAGASFPDPLAEDDADDEIVITTRRAIGRVALVATETATRFQREGVVHDPMAWMLASRSVFEGSSAIDACLDRDACLRGIIVHGLGLALDVERSAVDALLANDDDDLDEQEFNYLYGDRFASRGKAERGRSKPTAKVRLYTATIVDTRNNKMSQIFHASLARDATEVRARLAGRFGPDVANLADIRLGVHFASPPVVALVPKAVLELIRRMERDCAKPYARSFAVDIEMGIQA